MVLLKLLTISTVLSVIISYIKCQSDSDLIKSKLTSFSPALTNSLMRLDEKSTPNNFGQRFLDDQINIANLGIKLLQSDAADIDSYNGNSNININNNHNSNFPWHGSPKLRYHKKLHDHTGSRRVHEMQQQQLRNIFQMMMPQGSRSNQNTDLPTEFYAEYPFDNRYFRRHNEMDSQSIFDQNYQNSGANKIIKQSQYCRNIHSGCLQRITNIKNELQYLEDEFVKYCNQPTENLIQ